MAPRIWITNITDLLDKKGNPAPGAAGALAEHLGTLITVASMVNEEDRVPTGVPCRARPGRRRCGGRLALYVSAPNAKLRQVIHWGCPECGVEGQISNWEGTLWDLSHEVDIKAGAEELRRAGSAAERGPLDAVH